MYQKAKVVIPKTSIDIVKVSDKDEEFFRKLESQNITLNERQIEAVRHVNGPALVLAAAGSGKTSVLTSRVCRLITVEDVDPNRILAFTFTSKAAKEMKDRLGKMANMSSETASRITTGTFHSVFLSILRENRLDKEIWSSTKSREITVKMILKKLGMEKLFEPEIVISQIANYKNKLIDVEDAPIEDKLQRDFLLVWKEYEKHKKNNDLIDFDDMLVLAYKLFNEQPKVLEEIRDRFDYIHIDEYQDTNYAQLTLAKMIAYPKNNLFVVGDDFQCVYSFQGARSEHILNFNQMYPTAKIIPLEVNYRSTDQIIGLGNSIIEENKKQMKKNVYSVKPSKIEPTFIQPASAELEAQYIAEEIEYLVEDQKCKFKDFAILYRNNNNSRAIFDELLIRKIPFVQFGDGTLFYEDAIVKPIISYLRLSLKPDDYKSIEKILPTLYLKKDLVSFIKRQQTNKKLTNPIEHVLDYGLKPFQANRVREKIGMIKRLSDYKPVVAINMIRDDYEWYLVGDENDSEETTLYKEVIKETLDELVASSVRFNTIQEYIDFINLVIKNNIIQKEMQKNPNADSVRLMTIHRSKGLEFERVYIIHTVEGVLPSTNALEERSDVIVDDETHDGLEEERRLMYVGVTRAKEFLTVSSPQMYRGRFVEPSRFIEKYINKN